MSGAKERKHKMFDLKTDYAIDATFGFSGMVKEAVSPEESFSKEHWLNSFGLAGSVFGVGKLVTSPVKNSVSATVDSKALEKVKNETESTSKTGIGKTDEGTPKGTGEGINKEIGIDFVVEGWNLSEGGGEIRGRKYSQHALERMAPDIPEVKATLTSRAIKKARELGFKPQTKEFSDFIKKYVDPRDIPPLVIEDAIINTKKIPGNRNGTFVHETQDVKVVINETGDVITVIPK